MRPLDKDQHLAAMQWNPDEQGPSLDPQTVFDAGLRNHNIANTAYPIAHRRTIWRYRQRLERLEQLLTESFACAPAMGLYVHIPFCEARCRYCEYVVVDRHTAEGEAAYMRGLFAELDRYRDVVHGKPLVGLDFGGGTPALVDAAHIERLVRYVDEHFVRAPGFSMSIETTPRLAAAHPERLGAYRAAGIDRISMGVQTVSRNLLERYDRDHGRVRHNQQAVFNLRRAGFERFNVDAMYGFAHQKTDDLLATLEHIFALDPEYITLYRMRYKGTRVSHEAADVRLQRVNDMYEAAYEQLAAHGYVENYGKNGFSRVAGDPGTSAYLTSRVVESVPYLGVGLGAQTFTNNLLAYNLGAADKKLKRYLKAVDEGRLPIQDLYHLPLSEAMAKMVSVAFYFGEIDRAAFAHRFQVELQEHFADQVAYLTEQRLMELTPTKLRITKKGAQHFGGVVAQFYSPAVQQVLVEK